MNMADIRLGVVGPDGKSGRVKDASGRLTTTPPMACDLDIAIVAALGEYERRRPLEVSVAVDATGASDYSLATVMPEFVDGFSSICSVVYPWNGVSYPVPLEPRFYALARTPSGPVFRWVYSRPSGQQFLVTHTKRHTVTASQASVWPGDEEAVKDLSAAHCCEVLAGYYNQVVDSSIAADAVDRRSLADMYRSQAKRWRDAFEAKMPKRPPVVQVDVVRG